MSTLALYLSGLCDVFFIVIFMFITIDLIKMRTLVFCAFFRICTLIWHDNTEEERKQFSNCKSCASGYCLVFAYFLSISAWCCL